MKKYLLKLSILVGILLISLLSRFLILDRARPVTLKSGGIPAAVEKALQNTSPDSYLAIQGKDYTIKHIQCFEGGQWAVASIKPVGTSSDSGMIVFEQRDGNYHAVLGPGSSFIGANLSSLPTDVAKYINP